jgi:hypothetical protein
MRRPDHAHAQPLDGLRWAQARRLEHLRRINVVREASPGLYYLSAPDLADHLTTRRHRVAAVLLAVLILFGISSYYAVR